MKKRRSAWEIPKYQVGSGDGLESSHDTSWTTGSTSAYKTLTHRFNDDKCWFTDQLVNCVEGSISSASLKGLDWPI
jgi:hypothetical protein